MPRIKSLIKFSIRLFFLGLLLGVIGFTVLWALIWPSLPDVETLRDVELQVPLRVYSAEGELMAEIGEQRRIPLSIEEIPELQRQAFLAAEDDGFYNHFGIDVVGTLRGVVGYARYLGQRRVPGGSTITQQVARRFFLTNEFSVTRKIREIFLAVKIERELEKDEIFELYLNKEFLGQRAYGVGAAAQIYYGKTIDELTLAEMAMIAGLPKAPSRDNPVSNPEAATARRGYVLDRMLAEGFISEAEWREASNTPDRARLHGPQRELDAPWVAEIVRREAVERFGASEAYTGGYEIVTTVVGELQRAADRAIQDGLDAYDKRHGWRDAEGRIEPERLDDREAVLAQLRDLPSIGDLIPAVVLEVEPEQARLLLVDGREATLLLGRIEWARPFLGRDALGASPSAVGDILAVGDRVRLREHPEGWRLAQVPEAQAALVSLKPDSGEVVALVGGLDFAASQFNRATQSRRQPGSAFKPFIYSAALDAGYTPASLVNDAPVVFDDPSQERTWKPQNFSERFFGPTRLREGMVHSRNLISVRLVMDLGLPRAIDYVTDFGFDRNEIPNGPSMALGSASITPLDLAAAYAVFANGGYRIEPHFILAIRDIENRELDLPRRPRVCADCPSPQPDRAEAAVAEPDASSEGLRSLELLPGDTAPTDAPEAETPAMELAGPPVPLHAEQVLSPQTAWLIRSMMSDVITGGTGRRALALGRDDLAGKTGTTNDQRDTWFAGFNDALVTTVWVGMDGNEELGRYEQGGRTALPIWVDYMQVALDGVPETERRIPIGIVQAAIDPVTGLRVRPGTPGAIQEWFPAGNLPPLQETVDPNAEAEDADPYEIY
ncbi:penicillin-binding protein 1A [Wenzhouxiangella sp. XN79A]|uniref:penicillin-binding protein 1A n=1 Tax=Wenzhouxiangella sp. XN79A TaxID=2724193 RepID=UPI00144AE891|nr:penicillin-binding protein 1A [Wenzhouxiangella sp. XN79A]NKI35306.1 penicillin-binding protein 1A [Wenzhouxiangella sp. XN79A]